MKAGSMRVIARCRPHKGGYHSTTLASDPRKADAPKMIMIKPASEISALSTSSRNALGGFFPELPDEVGMEAGKGRRQMGA